MRNKRDVRKHTLYTETISESTQIRTDEILVRLLIPWNTWKTEDLSSSRAAFVFPDLCASSLCFKARLSAKPLIPNHAGKLTHFHNKGFVICLVLKERVLGLNWKLLIQLLCHALKGCFYFPLVNNY